MIAEPTLVKQHSQVRNNDTVSVHSVRARGHGGNKMIETTELFSAEHLPSEWLKNNKTKQRHCPNVLLPNSIFIEASLVCFSVVRLLGVFRGLLVFFLVYHCSLSF